MTHDVLKGDTSHRVRTRAQTGNPLGGGQVATLKVVGVGLCREVTFEQTLKGDEGVL